MISSFATEVDGLLQLSTDRISIIDLIDENSPNDLEDSDSLISRLNDK
jgi:hypothetical protein